MIYVVLGMHKSGTTLVSQILHHSGINMGDHIDPNVSYDQGNKYERLATRSINLELLGIEDVSTPSVNPRVHSPISVSDGQRARMTEIIRTCSTKFADWGFKDPRTCLTYPAWASELPEHKIIAVFRPHTEIWPRYRYDSFYRYYKNIPRALAFAQGWYRHNLGILEHIQKSSMDYLVLSYHQLLSDDTEFHRIEAFVDKSLDDQRRNRLYRGRSRTDAVLKIAMWVIGKQMGCTPDQILARFESLRRTAD